MGTDLRCHLEYRERDRWIGFGGRFTPRRDYVLFGLLANVRGTGALYTPRGIPRDADVAVRNSLCLRVVDDLDSPSARRWHGLLATRLEAEQTVASGSSSWWDEDRNFVTDPDSFAGSWLTTAELRLVLARYDEYIPEYLAMQRLQQQHDLAQATDEWYRQSIAKQDWGAERAADWLDIEMRMILAAMEAGEARGFPVRCIFWFMR